MCTCFNQCNNVGDDYICVLSMLYGKIVQNTHILMLTMVVIFILCLQLILDEQHDRSFQQLMHCMLKDHIHRRFHMSPLVGVFFFILSLFCSPILEYQPSDSAYARTYTQSTTKKIHHPTTHIICICVCVRDIYRFISLKFCVCHTFVRYNINNNKINNPKKKTIHTKSKID